MKNISSKLRVAIGTLIAVLAPAAIVYAALNTLNGQNGATQTFSNDSNVTISSASNVHTLGWSGVLPISRGGTGTSTYVTGSIPFFDGTKLTENAGLKFDPVFGLIVLEKAGALPGITTPDGTTQSPNGDNLSIQTGRGYISGTGDSGVLYLTTGDGGTVGNSGDINIITGAGGSTSGNSGSIKIETQSANIGNGGDIIFLTGGSTNGAQGHLKFASPPNGSQVYDILDSSGLTTSDRTFFFPDKSGTISLLQGVSTSTIQIGDIKSCIVMADSDGSGVTYVTANDGVLSATTTQPSNCQ